LLVPAGVADDIIWGVAGITVLGTPMAHVYLTTTIHVK
jgi:hypothetical protein